MTGGANLRYRRPGDAPEPMNFASFNDEGMLFAKKYLRTYCMPELK
jgi:hypothetical protein